MTTRKGPLAVVPDSDAAAEDDAIHRIATIPLEDDLLDGEDSAIEATAPARETPSEPREQREAFHDDGALPERDPWPTDVELLATCAGVSGRGASTVAGPRGVAKFELDTDVEHVAAIFGAIGQVAFDITFAKAHLGDGYTIASMDGRPDANGTPRAFVVFNAPETSVRALGALFSRGLIGTKGKLTLGTSQISMSELLTRRAE